MKKPHYAWVICAACTLLMFCVMGIGATSFSVFNPYITAAGHLTNTQLSVVSTVRSVTIALTMFYSVWLYGKLGPRLCALLACLAEALGFLMFAFSGGFLAYCVSIGVIGAAYGVGAMMLAAVIIPPWFESHRALALGISAAGSGVAAVIVPPLTTSIIAGTSLRAAFLLDALFVAVCGVLIFAVVRAKPQEMGLQPLRAPESKSADAAAKKADAAAPHSRRAVLFMCVGYALFAGMAGPGTAFTTMLFSTSGYGDMTTAVLLSAYGAALTVGKLCFGQLVDRFGTRRVSLLFFGIVTVSGVLLCFPRFAPAAWAGSALLGFGIPLSTVGVPLFAADAAEPGGYTRALKAINFTFMVSSLVFYPLPGLLADSLGSYVPSYAIFTLLTVAGAALVLLAYRAPAPSEVTAPGGEQK